MSALPSKPDMCGATRDVRLFGGYDFPDTEAGQATHQSQSVHQPNYFEPKHVRC